MYADQLIWAVHKVLGTTGARSGTKFDQEYERLNARHSELYHRILGGLEDRGLCGLAADVQELVAVLGRIARVSEKHAYAKGDRRWDVGGGEGRKRFSRLPGGVRRARLSGAGAGAGNGRTKGPTGLPGGRRNPSR